ncbi:MAG: GNAT family N-acetyltransferase [Cyclobacteriaceae bacterium]|nr:GNAT family N-acetyltransferase [Cyclobacteriaceae bacterium]MCB0505670.1 GNAT family N-acetyltransferase [Cyclobacteriaceae bacterium]MCB9236640.1 GNAT family N-acetyltransferase [Flammeovirgaceae bacterium]
MEYNIERISRERLQDLIPVFKGAFKRNVTIAELKAKYETGFLGLSYLGYIAYYTPDRQPAAYYGVFPMEAIIEGKHHVIVQSGDTMTHPNHQGKGLFVKLAKQTYELCVQLGISGVFGFPSESSYPGFVRKLRWQHHENIENYTAWVYTLPLSTFLKVKYLRFLYHGWVRFILSFYPSGKRFESLVLRNSTTGIARSADFWEYKLRNPDNVCLRVGGTSVILKTGVSLRIGDIDLSNKNKFDKAFTHLKWLAFFLGMPRISFYCSPGTMLGKVLRTKLVPKPGLAIGYLNFQKGIDLAPLKYTYFDFDTF